MWDAVVREAVTVSSVQMGSSQVCSCDMESVTHEDKSR